MLLYSDCIGCLINAQVKSLSDCTDEKKKNAYIKDICAYIGTSGPDASAPYLASQISKIRERYFGPTPSMLETKMMYNHLLLNIESDIAEKIHSSKDPLKTALLYCRIGNYIDFSALDHVSTDEFLGLLERQDDILDEKEYQYLCQDLSHAGELLYILDNCGEIVLDKLVIQELIARYPNLHITAMVRGGEAVNDATKEDATCVGLDKLVPIITTCFPAQGVVYSKLGETERILFDTADILISKGQANYESISGCGRNIYYLFLCKCDLFTKRFGVKKLTGMIVNELRSENYGK